MTSDFIEIYGTTGYFLRRLDLNTTSRVAMLASLLHLQSGDDFVKFDDFYEFSLKTTDEKLETSSFKSLISKMHKAVSDKQLIDEGEVDGDKAFRATTLLLNLFEQGEAEFNEFLEKIL